MFGRSIAASFGVQPDFAKIAEACACYGERVEDPRNIRGALVRALEANASGVPAVLDFLVAEDTPQGRLDFLAAR
jgi:acetolactate synthase-1/2/3 large subunit